MFVGDQNGWLMNYRVGIDLISIRLSALAPIIIIILFNIIMHNYTHIGRILPLNNNWSMSANIPPVLGNVVCSGNETSLLNCSHEDYHTIVCTPNKEIVIVCLRKFFAVVICHMGLQWNPS